MNTEAEANVSFGSVFNNNIAMNEDSESALLCYEKPSYAANFSTYVEAKIPPEVNPYDNSLQTLKFRIGSNEDLLYSDLSTLRCVGRLKVLHADDSNLDEGEAISVVNIFPETIFAQINTYLNGEY